MNERITHLEQELAQRNERLEEIERGLHQLVSVRAKTNEPAEDYTGEVGERKHREWDSLWAEKERLQSEVRQLEDELYALTHSGR